MRWLIALWLLCQAALVHAAPSDPFPKIASAYWVSLDQGVVWAKQADRRLPPASLTKLMTALLVVEHGASPLAMQAVVRVSAAAAREAGSRMGLKSGDRLTVLDLLAASLVASANDACHALADHVAGDQARFVARMNARAASLGLRNTHFVNACGHDAPGHYASAADLGVLAQALLLHPLVLELTRQREIVVTTVEGGRRFTLRNTNALVGRYVGALGLKTGYTSRAGRCLVAVAHRAGSQVLLVMLNGADRWWDAVDVLDLAFARANH